MRFARWTGTPKNSRMPMMLPIIMSEQMTATSPEVRCCSDR